MKAFLVFTFAFLFAAAAYARTLITPSFVVVIINNEPEGVVSSHDIMYVGVSRKTGKTLTCKGRTVHTMEADGVTPNKFLGYAFTHDKVSYFVGEEGSLRVTSGKKVLLEETGRWED